MRAYILDTFMYMLWSFRIIGDIRRYWASRAHTQLPINRNLCTRKRCEKDSSNISSGGMKNKGKGALEKNCGAIRRNKQLFIMINFQLSTRNWRLCVSYFIFVIYSRKSNLWAIFFPSLAISHSLRYARFISIRVCMCARVFFRSFVHEFMRYLLYIVYQPLILSVHGQI